MVPASEIPIEFLPKESKNEPDTGEFGTLFDHEDDISVNCDDDEEEADNNNDDGGATEQVTISQQTYRLKTPPDVGTLFAHQVWSGSKFLAEFLATHADEYVKNKRTVEFGAGTALPSLVALQNESRLSVITDYPDENVLQAIRETVGYNWAACGEPHYGRVAVVGHEWGTDTDKVFNAVRKSRENEEGDEVRFDLAILSECLWMHRTHAALAKSLSLLLSDESFAIATYAHHVPGCEKEDDAFFAICKDYGFSIVQEESQDMAYMWDSTKTIVVHLKVLQRSRANDTT